MWVAPHLHFCKPMLISPANPCPPRSSALHAHAKRRHPLFSNLAPIAHPAQSAPTSFSTSLSAPSARCPPRRLPVPVLVRESTTVKCYMVHPSGNHLVISNQLWKKGLLLAKRGRFRDLLIGHPNGSLPALLLLLIPLLRDQMALDGTQWTPAACTKFHMDLPIKFKTPAGARNSLPRKIHLPETNLSYYQIYHLLIHSLPYVTLVGICRRADTANVK